MVAVDHLPAAPRFAETWEDFRPFLMPFDSERLVDSRGMNLEDYSQTIITTDRAQGLLRRWAQLLAEPFAGITVDGVLRQGLFELADEGFDPAPAVTAAEALLGVADAGERDALRQPLSSSHWRGWYNPEWLVNDHGLRLDRARPATREAAVALVRSCLSAEGFAKFEQARSANLYLGEIYDLRQVLSEWSFHFLLFGTPSLTEPWGFSFYGHHITVSCLILGRQIVISPTFLGVEPTVIDRGGDDRFTFLAPESVQGLALMRSLTADQQARATVFAQMHDPAMAPDRWHFADERQLGGAYQDNRVIPYEGVRVDEFTEAQREAVLAIAAQFLVLLPDGPRAARLAQIAAHLDETWWSWIGATGDDAPFYYRIQSPVVMLEFDNHSGVWLTNPEPAKFHVHTIVRTPNGNDYGTELVRQHAAGGR